MDVNRYHYLKSPVTSSFTEILRSFFNGVHCTIKFFRFICCFKIFDYVALEIRIQRLNILIEYFISNHLTIQNNIVLRFSLISLKTSGFAICMSKTFKTLNSKLPRETSRCAGCFTNSELSALPINLFDFSDFSLSLSFFWTWCFDFLDIFSTLFWTISQSEHLLDFSNSIMGHTLLVLEVEHQFLELSDQEFGQRSWSTESILFCIQSWIPFEYEPFCLSS